MQLRIQIEKNIAVNYGAEFISVRPLPAGPRSGVITIKLRDNGSTRLIQKNMECHIINSSRRNIRTIIQEVTPNGNGILLKCLASRDH